MYPRTSGCALSEALCSTKISGVSEVPRFVRKLIFIGSQAGVLVLNLCRSSAGTSTMCKQKLVQSNNFQEILNVHMHELLCSFTHVINIR